MDQYGYVIVNDDLDVAVSQLEAIAEAEKQRSTRFFPAILEE